MMQKREEKDIAEIQILQALKDGETYAFDYLFGKYSDALYHMLLLMSGKIPVMEKEKWCHRNNMKL